VADPAAGASPAAVTVTGDSAGSGESGARRMAYRALGLALPSGALGAALVLVAAGKTWTKGTVGLGSNGLPVHATGTQSTALPGALALVGLAALVAVFAVRRIGRYAVAGLLTLSGIGVVVTVLARRADHGALNAAAASATGLSHSTAEHAATTSWPLVAVAGGLLLLLAGLLALRYGRRWPAMSAKYDRPGARTSLRARATAPVTVDPDRAEDLWKALDRGEDPTTIG
jgi:uncharacterized membrane protein (TIGR02234 family)